METKRMQLKTPEGKSLELPTGVTGKQVVEVIDSRRASEAIVVKVNGCIRDLSIAIEEEGEVEIVTRDTPEGIEILRHDAAHVLAEAVKELYPETQVTIGPVIENGFYYDFARKESFSERDLIAIEKRMKEIVDRDEHVIREVWNRDEAIRFFQEQGETYKAEIIRDLPLEETITLYRQGNFIDLCRGPHLPSTGRLGKAFKLTKVAGSYWRGDVNNEMLQRIYGTAWARQEDLKNYLHQLEEAEKRDHRKLGRGMDLFHFQEESPGAVFWHPKGWTLFCLLIDYLRKKQQSVGYEEINTPDILDQRLWERSGHWEKFSENMLTIKSQNKERLSALRPMNCPGGIQIFKQGITSYRDLPRRLSEFGKVHRYEPSGVLHGLLRVRSFTQDDAHIFCTEDQIISESKKICSLIREIYKDFGFEDVRVNFADRPSKRVGSDAVWDKAEAALKEAARSAGLECHLNTGEGAFYGPKLEFILRDAIGRRWQLGTLQVDLNLPERLEAYYMDENNQKRSPVVLHRAIFGSLERFIGILVEHYAGHLPLWLAPTQAVVATIGKDQEPYAGKLLETLKGCGFRVEADMRNEKMGYKLREHTLAKIPILLIIGKKEAEAGLVSVRQLGNRETYSCTLENFTNLMSEATRRKQRDLVFNPDHAPD